MHDRRDFLRLGVGSTLASVAIGDLRAAAEPQIRRDVRLGHQVFVSCGVCVGPRLTHRRLYFLGFLVGDSYLAWLGAAHSASLSVLRYAERFPKFSLAAR